MIAETGEIAVRKRRQVFSPSNRERLISNRFDMVTMARLSRLDLVLGSENKWLGSAIEALVRRARFGRELQVCFRVELRLDGINKVETAMGIFTLESAGGLAISDSGIAVLVLIPTPELEAQAERERALADNSLKVTLTTRAYQMILLKLSVNPHEPGIIGGASESWRGLRRSLGLIRRLAP
jgi:hypothetical protein